MLAPDDRQLLLSQLQAPPGTLLDHAVATTFTLDLESALIAPFAAASRMLTDKIHPIAALQALRSTADRIDIFYQNGHLAVPSARSGLHAFMEQMLHPVRQPRPGRLFHPKLWLMRFVAADPGAEPAADLYRLVVTSRNITADSSWDLVIALDGSIGSKLTQTNNAPLAKLIMALPGLSFHELSATRRDRLERLAKDVRKVTWELPPGIQNLWFHVFGISGHRAHPEFNGSKRLIISPFMTDGGLQYVAPDGQAPTILVSTVESLDFLHPDSPAHKYPMWVVNPLAGLAAGEGAEGFAAHTELVAPAGTPPPTAPTPGVLSGLHAKAYVVERGSRAYLFAGSANATDAAFGGNVEILLELEGAKKEFGVDKILGADGMGSILLPHAPDISATEPSDTLDRLNAAVRALAAIMLTGTVVEEGGAYRMELESTAPATLPSPMKASLELPTAPGQGIALIDGSIIKASFGPLKLSDITAWLILRVSESGTECSTTVKAVLINDPADRLSAVLAAQIDSTEKFLMFLSLLLQFENSSWLGQLPETGDGSGAFGFGVVGQRGLFESMVRALATDPKALESVGDLISRLECVEEGRTVVPRELLALWPLFDKALIELGVNG